MIIEQSFTVNASRQEAADFFVDIDRVAGCVPGVEDLEEVEPGRYKAVLTVRLGPIRAAFQGTMALDASEAPARLKAAGEGRDRATGSVAKVDFTADLVEETSDHTTVKAVADVALRGRMAQFGTGVMRAAAGELVQEFAGCANARLAEAADARRADEHPVDSAGDSAAPGEATAATPGTAAPRPTAPAPAASAPKGMGGLILRSVLRAAWQGLGGLATRLRRTLSDVRKNRR